MNILILTHECDRFHRHYYLYTMAETWAGEGHRVRIQRGPGARADADIAILHVDLTVVPPDYLEFARRFPVVVNSKVEDISKRGISRNLVRPEDDFQGPVIVKTNLNAGGQREALLAHRQLPLLLRRGPFRRAVPRKSKRDYLVYSSPKEVPHEVWEDPALVVERFLPEPRGDFFYTHNWAFFGDREFASRLVTSTPVSGGSVVVRRETVEGVPDELRQRREELGFDFGKFDFTVADGRPVLFDVNRTPVLTDVAWGRPKLVYLAGGLSAFG